jgi:uncharacterized protein YprB with RNaseH-like and TPR domain
MGNLVPVAFDIETSGLDRSAVLTVAGLAFDAGVWIGLNTGGADLNRDPDRLVVDLEHDAQTNVKLAPCRSETQLLTALTLCVRDRIDGDRHYITAYNGETWNSGFDLPFLRRVCVRHNASWPFTDLAYADVLEMIDRVDTGDAADLTTVYDDLIGEDHCDPFTDSESAVAAFENGDWLDLLLHNIADIQRTRALAVLAGQYVAASDFGMKNLDPPDV